LRIAKLPIIEPSPVAEPFGLILAAISQMSENSADTSPNATIQALINDLEGMELSALL
jgi:hypothetical protein